MSYTAEDFIYFIESGRLDKISNDGLELIAKRFRELESKTHSPKELKPSGFGVVVDKSGATKTHPLRSEQITCEHPECNSTDGRDYKPKKSLIKKILNTKNDWDSEPEFLCDKHSKRRNPVKKGDIRI